MPKYKYIGKKDFIIGLKGERFEKGVIFEESNPKNPFEGSKDFEKIKEKKKKEKKKVFIDKKIVKPKEEEEVKKW